MVVKGIVLDVVFHNPDTGYTVFDFDAEGRYLTAVGIFPALTEGEALTLVGDFKTNAKYGEQFEVTEAVFDAPADVAAIEHFLAGGLFSGIGEVKARAIVERFGAGTLDVIEHTPERLAEVKGISKSGAAAIAASYRETVGIRNAVLFLQKYEIPMKLCLKICRAYGDRTVETVRENPYRLVRDIVGVGFLTADRIARQIGIPEDSDFRIYAGIVHVLREEAGKAGHTCLPREELTEPVLRLLGAGDEDRIARAVKVMMLNGELTAERTAEEGKEYLALSVNSRTENAIAARLCRLQSGAKATATEVSSEIAHFETQNNVKFHPTQTEAIAAALSNGVVVVTGGPGTGKTTIIKCMIELFSARNLRVALAAPTGRAGKRMSEATGMDAKTIHRLIGISFSEEGGENAQYNELNPLPVDVVIVDEVSMADIYVFSALLKAMSVGTRLILVGDKDQLPSVSAGNILADVIASGLFPVVSLTEIYRQSADSLIVYNAHRINNGELPVIDNRARDFFFDRKSEPDDALQSVVSLVTARLPKHFGIDPADIQVLAPIKKGVVGVEHLNRCLQDALNPSGVARIHKGVTFRVGDKVMQTVNNYTLVWARGSERGEGVFNGDIGHILNIAHDELFVAFDDGKIVRYAPQDQDELTLAYAVSVHKSQGSEFKAVILVLSGGSPYLLNRNLLYTAVTRAKDLVVIVGTVAVLERMIANRYVAKRYTLLKEYLWINRRKLDLLTGR